MKSNVGSFEICLTRSDTLYFTSSKFNSSFKFLYDFIIKECFLIFDNVMISFLRGHKARLIYKKIEKSLFFTKNNILYLSIHKYVLKYNSNKFKYKFS